MCTSVCLSIPSSPPTLSAGSSRHWELSSPINWLSFRFVPQVHPPKKPSTFNSTPSLQPRADPFLLPQPRFDVLFKHPRGLPSTQIIEMLVAFAALFFSAILTLWVPGYWPVTVFQVGIFALAGIAVLHARLSPPPFAWPFIPLSFAVLWGLFQLLTSRTA